MVGAVAGGIVGDRRVLSALFALLVAHAGSPVNPILRVITTTKGYASLSQFQIVLWTFVVGSSVIYVMALSGELIKITTGTLVLLGISGTAALSSQLKSKDEDAKDAANGAGGNAADAKAKMAKAKAAAAARAAAKEAKTSPHVPSWCDLVIEDGQIDVTRLQMLYFTVVMAVFVLMTVVSSYEIPEIPQSFLILMGISNGVYVAGKIHQVAPHPHFVVVERRAATAVRKPSRADAPRRACCQTTQGARQSDLSAPL